MNKEEILTIIGKTEYASEIKLLKSHMGNMHTAIRQWGIKAKLIDLDPEAPKQDLSKEIKKAISEFAKKESKKVAEVTKDETAKLTKKVEGDNKPEKHHGYFIIQGEHTSPNGNKFNFQVVREHGVTQENGKPQYKVILQYAKDQCIETFPQTNPDLKSAITNYIYNPAPQKLSLLAEEKTTSDKK